MSTLLMLVLLAGLASIIQSKSMAQSRVLSRTVNQHLEEINWQSAYAVTLPLIGESILLANSEELAAPFSVAGDMNRTKVGGDTFQFRIVPQSRRNWYKVTREQ